MTATERIAALQDAGACSPFRGRVRTAAAEIEAVTLAREAVRDLEREIVHALRTGTYQQAMTRELQRRRFHLARVAAHS